MGYQENIEENQKHLRTEKSEWRADLETPKYFKQAPSLFTEADCCQWCGKNNVKDFFPVYHEAKKFYLMVGSECVRHVAEGKSGKELSKEAIWQENREFVKSFEEAKRQIFISASYEQKDRWGNSHRHLHSSMNRGVNLYNQAKKLLKNIQTESYGPHREASNNASITRWIKKNKEAAEELILKINEELA